MPDFEHFDYILNNFLDSYKELKLVFKQVQQKKAEVEDLLKEMPDNQELQQIWLVYKYQVQEVKNVFEEIKFQK